MTSSKHAGLLASLAMTAVLCAAAGTTEVATAANATDIAVSGRIQPAGNQCRVWTSQPPDFGEILSSDLKPNAHGIAILPKAEFTISVGCTQPDKFGIRLTDGQATSAVDDDAFVATVTDATHHGMHKDALFGLGRDRAGQRIGAWIFEGKEQPFIRYLGNDGKPAEDYYARLLMQTRTGWEWVGLPPMRAQTAYTATPSGYGVTLHPRTTDFWVRGHIMPFIDAALAISI